MGEINVKTINTYYENYRELSQFVINNYDTIFLNNRTVLVQVFSGNCDRAFLCGLSKEIIELVPHAHILGATTSGEIMNGMVSGLKTVLSFSVFEHSDIKTSFVTKTEKTDYEMGRAVATALDIDNAKVLILFATGFTVDSSQILRGVQSVNAALPVAGGNSADNFVHQTGFVFCNEGITDCGVVGVALISERLTVNCHWHLGWQPIGKEMTVTKADGLRVYTIDHIPAFQVYRKYLGLDEAADISNVLEFPLLTYRSGVQLARVPHVRYDDDSIGFAADMFEGEKVRFSFGLVEFIIETAHNLFQIIKQQPAESIFVYSCSSRRGFLQELSQVETMPLQELAPVAGFFTHGEFFYANKEILLLNCTMTTLVLSELSNSEDALMTKTEMTEHNPWLGNDIAIKKNSVADRNLYVLKSLTYLVNTVTGELQEANDILQFISLHDSLTGLYNLRFFEQDMRRLDSSNTAVGMIMCDVDGLKLVNDILGHDVGDATLKSVANILKSLFTASEMIARIGGDEFAIILSDSSPDILENFCVKIREAVDRYNTSDHTIPLSVSTGWSFAKKAPCEITTLFKKADDEMYREKLHRSQSVHGNLIQTLMKTLEARDFITEEHANRLQDMVAVLAENIGFSQNRILDLRLFARFHDIGKIGIPDRILLKPGPLTPNEKKEMQQHCEIGFRIARSTTDLMPIADWILKHHEWWNGEGYPSGMAGEKIPIECRILAIIDAYDAMTNDRPYRKAMSHQAACEELERKAGIQFDPKLIKKFISLISESCLK